jgi:hypothetical protein
MEDKMVDQRSAGNSKVRVDVQAKLITTAMHEFVGVPTHAKSVT